MFEKVEICVGESRLPASGTAGSPGSDQLATLNAMAGFFDATGVVAIGHAVLLDSIMGAGIDPSSSVLHSQYTQSATYQFDKLTSLVKPTLTRYSEEIFTGADILSGFNAIGVLDNVGDFPAFHLVVEVSGMAPGDAFGVFIQNTTAGAPAYTVFQSSLLSVDGTYIFRMGPTLDAQGGLVAKDYAARTAAVYSLSDTAAALTVTTSVHWMR